MAGTKCDATDCNRAVDHVCRIVRPDWMAEQLPSVSSNETKAYLCSRHRDGFGETVSATVEEV